MLHILLCQVVEIKVFLFFYFFHVKIAEQLARICPTSSVKLPLLGLCN